MVIFTKVVELCVLLLKTGIQVVSRPICFFCCHFCFYKKV